MTKLRIKYVSETMQGYDVLVAKFCQRIRLIEKPPSTIGVFIDTRILAFILKRRDGYRNVHAECECNNNRNVTIFEPWVRKSKT